MTAAQTTARQLSRLAPLAVTYRGKTYRRADRMLVDDSTSTAIVHYDRRSRGAFMADRVAFFVAYDDASDTYSIVTRAFDGATFDQVEIGSVEGCTWDTFERLGILLPR